jgi:predicted RNA-binding Zn ribbon-like protein
MSHTQHAEPFFVADHRALDFLNSVATPQDERIDWLVDGPSFLRWLVRAFDVDADLSFAGARLDEVAARARLFREWFRGFVEKHAGELLRPSQVRSLRPLNAVLSVDRAYQQVVSAKEGATLVLRTQRDFKSAADLLQPIAHAVADLLCNADFEQVRQCEGANCTLWFLDISKSHKRRWCSMAVCGNRAKVAQHRARQRGNP